MDSTSIGLDGISRVVAIFVFNSQKVSELESPPLHPLQATLIEISKDNASYLKLKKVTRSVRAGT